MAITNKEIMAMYRAENNIPEDKELYTYAVWKSKGYQVKRGEACRFKVQMWKYNPKAQKAVVEPAEPSEGKKKPAGRNCFMKTVYLFERSQVEIVK